jgi:hypothetical protein
MEFKKYNFGPELMSVNVDMQLCEELLLVGKNEQLINEKIKSISFNSSFKYSSENVSYFKDRIFVFIENIILKIYGSIFKKLKILTHHIFIPQTFHLLYM